MLAMLASGCAYTWHLDGEKVTKQSKYAQPVVDRKALRPTGELLADGRYRVKLGGDALCRRQRTDVEDVSAHESRRYSVFGAILQAETLLGIALGVDLIVQSGNDDLDQNGKAARAIGGTFLTIFEAAGAGVLLGFRLSSRVTPGVPLGDGDDPKVGDMVFWEGNYPLGWQRGKIAAVNLDRSFNISDLNGKGAGVNVSDDRVHWPTRTRKTTETVPCNDELLGKLALRTPWGITLPEQSAIGSPPAATFEIDWNLDNLDPKSAAGRARLAGPWVVQSSALGTIASIQLPDAEVARAADLVGDARTRIVKGATPASLVTAGFTVDGGVITPGSPTTLRLSVENRGASSARNVVVTTRSSLAELHDLKVQFDLLQPGKKAERTLSVTVPGNVSNPTVTVVLLFSEASGQIPQPVTQQLKLVNTVCPNGTFSRAEYEQKRGRLEGQLGKGITQDEFNKLDAELVRCIK